MVKLKWAASTMVKIEQNVGMSKTLSFQMKSK